MEFFISCRYLDFKGTEIDRRSGAFRREVPMGNSLSFLCFFLYKCILLNLILSNLTVPCDMGRRRRR